MERLPVKERAMLDCCATPGDPAAPQDSRTPCTRLSSASLQLEHPLSPSMPSSLTQCPAPSCPSSEAPQTTSNAVVAGWQCPGEESPGRVSGDMAQLAHVPVEDRRTKASSFHSDRHEFKEVKRLRQDQQMLPDRRNLLPLSGARDVFYELSRPGVEW